MGYYGYKMLESKIAYEKCCKQKWKEGETVTANQLHKKSAKEILFMCDQDGAVPVDIKKILKKLDISAMPIDFSGIEKKLPEEYAGLKILGAMASNDDKIAIWYRSEDKEDSHRMRFTIAHELAHCCLHGSRHHLEFRIDGDLDEDEILANTFAGELLIPEDSLKRTIDKLFVPTLNALADIFDVSVNVMRERIKFLQLEDKVATV